MENFEKEEMQVGDGMTPQEEEPLRPLTPQQTKTLKQIYKKKYAEGDVGKLEALNDLQVVFDELHDEKVISQPFNVSLGPTQPSSTKDIQDRQDLGDGPKTGRKGFTPLIHIKKTKEFASEQNIAIGRRLKEQTTSLPTLPRIEKRGQLISTPTINKLPTPLNPITELAAFHRANENLDLSSCHEAEEETDSEDGWKSDLDKLSCLKSTSKPNILKVRDGETLKLKYKSPIWPHQLGLHQLLQDRKQTLTCLVLDGSELECLRDLGSSIPSLVTLSVARCCLKSLDGTTAFNNLRTLIASNNNLQTPVPCSFLTDLSHLDLSSNPIKEIGVFLYLKACTKLRSLKLYSTPVSRLPNFYTNIMNYLSTLNELLPLSDFSTKINKGAKLVQKEDHSQKVLRNEFQVIYQKNFEKPKGYERKPLVRIGEEDGMTTDGTATETEDNFEKALSRIIENVTPPITTTDDKSGSGDHELICDDSEKGQFGNDPSEIE